MAAARSLQCKLPQFLNVSHFISSQSCAVPKLVAHLGLSVWGDTCCFCSQVRSVSSIAHGPASLFSNSTSQLLSVPTAQIQQLEYHVGTLTKKDLLSRVAAEIGFKSRMLFKKGGMQRAGIRMYLCAVELVDYDEFFTELQLPDTFNSWFRITELHIWMCLVRLGSEGREGTVVRNNMLKNLWQDVERRTKKLGDMASSSARREGIQQLSEQLQASFYSYDEGLLSNDMVLAGTVWRNFFEMNCDDPEKLEKIVCYIRKQISHHDRQTTERVVGTGVITFLPLTGEHVHLERTNPILEEIFRRS